MTLLDTEHVVLSLLPCSCGVLVLVPACVVGWFLTTACVLATVL